MGFDLLQASQLDVIDIIEHMYTITTFLLTLSKKNQYIEITLNKHFVIIFSHYQLSFAFNRVAMPYL